MQRFQDLVRTLTPLIVPLIALILSGLLSYFVTVSTLDAKISVQGRRLDAVERQQDKTDYKIDKVLESLSIIGADTRVTRAEVRGLGQRLDRMENRIDLANGRQ
jgi:peptidoglycan hydrolase CwlO-like protein